MTGQTSTVTTLPFSRLCFLYNIHSEGFFLLYSLDFCIILALIEATFLMCFLILSTPIPFTSVVFLQQETNVQNKRKKFHMNIFERLTPGNMDHISVLLSPFRCFYLCYLPQWKLCADTQQPTWCSWLANGEFFSCGKKRAIVLAVLNWYEIPRSKYMLSNPSCTFLLKQLSHSKCLLHCSYRLCFIRGVWALGPQKGKACFHIAFQTTPFPGN